MGLGGKIVDLVRQHLTDDTNKTGRIGQIAMMENKFSVTYMWILVKMVDAIRVKKRRPPLYAVYLVTFFEKELCQIRSVLPDYAGNEGFFSSLHTLFSFIFDPGKRETGRDSF